MAASLPLTRHEAERARRILGSTARSIPMWKQVKTLLDLSDRLMLVPEVIEGLQRQMMKLRKVRQTVGKRLTPMMSADYAFSKQVLERIQWHSDHEDTVQSVIHERDRFEADLAGA